MGIFPTVATPPFCQPLTAHRTWWWGGFFWAPPTSIAWIMCRSCASSHCHFVFVSAMVMSHHSSPPHFLCLTFLFQSLLPCSQSSVGNDIRIDPIVLITQQLFSAHWPRVSLHWLVLCGRKQFSCGRLKGCSFKQNHSGIWSGGSLPSYCCDPLIEFFMLCWPQLYNYFCSYLTTVILVQLWIIM